MDSESVEKRMTDDDNQTGRPLRIAVVGTGISGMAAAWLLAQRHSVTVYERAARLGGHTNTVMANTAKGPVPVDTGFIVYNERNYPNLVALFAHLDVPTKASDMSFGVSLDDGDFEYSGGDLAGLFAQPGNILRPRFWRMLGDLLRFYRSAPGHAPDLDPTLTLGDYLALHGYSRSFMDDHLLPMGGAIWSMTVDSMLDYPAAAFIRFHDNHGLLQVRDRPVWRTVCGGSRTYVEKLTALYQDHVRLKCGVRKVAREAGGVVVEDDNGAREDFDHVVFACHADQALETLADPSEAETTLLSRFRYSRNLAVLHQDDSLMPRRRKAWSSWNYVAGAGREGEASVTYWMNRLQGIDDNIPLFVTLNPGGPPRAGTLLHSELYEHPIFDTAAVAAQRKIWNLQGQRNSWFCGAYFGSGFHEDGLQAGLSVAEALGKVRRPWTVPNESGRITITPGASARRENQIEEAQVGT
jgi:predicted NAD/FAD-binding protein